MKYRIITFLVLGIALIFLAQSKPGQSDWAFTETINQHWLNFCIANSPGRITDAEITLVKIDDNYESALPSDHLTRLDYAVILANIEKFKPRSVAILPPLKWKEGNVINEKILQSQCSKIPALTLTAEVENSPVAGKQNVDEKYQALTHIEGDLSKITPFTRTLAYPEKSTLKHAKVTFAQIGLSDSVNQQGIHTLPLVARHGDDIVPSFILMAIIQHEKLKLSEVTLQLPPAVSKAQILIADKYTIPIDVQGHFKVYQDAMTSWEDLYKTIAATDLTLAHTESSEVKELQQDLEDDFNSLTNNLIVIGLDKAQDQHITLNNEEKISLTELVARTIATIQSGRFIEQWPPLWRPLSFALILLFAIKLYQLKRRQVLIWGSLIAFFYFIACAMLFSSTLLWTPPFISMALFVILISVGTILPYRLQDAANISPTAPQPPSSNLKNNESSSNDPS